MRSQDRIARHLNSVASVKTAAGTASEADVSEPTDNLLSLTTFQKLRYDVSDRKTRQPKKKSLLKH